VGKKVKERGVGGEMWGGGVGSGGGRGGWSGGGRGRRRVCGVGKGRGGEACKGGELKDAKPERWRTLL